MNGKEHHRKWVWWRLLGRIWGIDINICPLHCLDSHKMTFQSTQCAKWQRVIDSWPMHIGCVMRPLFRLLFLVLHLFIGSVSRQRLCITVSRVNFLITLCSHLNVSCCFWSSLLNVDVNYRYILSFSCSGYLKCIEKYIVKYTYSDSCWLFLFLFFGW